MLFSTLPYQVSEVVLHTILCNYDDEFTICLVIGALLYLTSFKNREQMSCMTCDNAGLVIHDYQ